MVDRKRDSGWDSPPSPPTAAGNAGPQPQRILIQQAPPPPPRGRWLTRVLVFALVLSLIANFQLYARYKSYFSSSADPIEKFHSGEQFATNKIAVLKAEGTIMGASTKRLLRAIEQRQRRQRGDSSGRQPGGARRRQPPDLSRTP